MVRCWKIYKNMISLVRPSTLLTPQQHRFYLLVLVEQHASWNTLENTRLLASNGDAHWVLLPNIKNVRNNHSWMRTLYPSPPIYHLLRVGECHFKLKTGNPSNTPQSLMVKLCYIMASPKCSLVKTPESDAWTSDCDGSSLNSIRIHSNHQRHVPNLVISGACSNYHVLGNSKNADCSP